MQLVKSVLIASDKNAPGTAKLDRVDTAETLVVVVLVNTDIEDIHSHRMTPHGKGR
jgi:hypothetical protein